MITYILALFVLGTLAIGALCIGVAIGRAVRDQFDELLPQRMVDYSGFIETGLRQD